MFSALCGPSIAFACARFSCTDHPPLVHAQGNPETLMQKSSLRGIGAIHGPKPLEALVNLNLCLGSLTPTTLPRERIVVGREGFGLQVEEPLKRTHCPESGLRSYISQLVLVFSCLV